MVFVRLDTHGGRYIEGLDIEKSYEVLEEFCLSIKLIEMKKK